jgi:hypothetical protein
MVPELVEGCVSKAEIIHTEGFYLEKRDGNPLFFFENTQKAVKRRGNHSSFL